MGKIKIDKDDLLALRRVILDGKTHEIRPNFSRSCVELIDEMLPFEPQPGDFFKDEDGYVFFMCRPGTGVRMLFNSEGGPTDGSYSHPRGTLTKMELK